MSRSKNKRLLALCGCLVLCGLCKLATVRAEVIEPGFPFLGLTVDAGRLGEPFPNNNLIPRGLVLPLGNDTYGCFDTDLLRLAVVWRAEPGKPPLDYRSVSTFSFHDTKKKAGGGQGKLSRPMGKTISATGIYPGCQRGEPKFEDPRPPGSDPREVGRGPYGSWEAIHDLGKGKVPVLHYSVGRNDVAERVDSIAFGREVAIRRRFDFRELEDRISIVIGEFSHIASVTADGRNTVIELGDKNVVAVHGKGIRVIENRYVLHDVDAVEHSMVIYWRGPKTELPSFQRRFAREDSRSGADERKQTGHWPKPITTRIVLGEGGSAYVFDTVELPPGRVVRPSCIDFFPDGRMVLGTIDGDVWKVSVAEKTATWRKIAGGLHEPQAIRVREDSIYVGSRNGIERLVDEGGDGETDIYVMHCNRFPQAADTRDFLHSMAFLPDGRLLFSKGGQQSSFINDFSGRVLELAPDGRTVSVFASGLRNAYIAAHPKTGLVTATDQQGHWVPTTPIHVIERGGYYGFHRAAPGGEKASEPGVHPPLAWIPHRLAQCGAGQVWAPENFGPLSGRLLMLDYYAPGILDVDHRTGAVSTLNLKPEVPVLKGAVNPKDGAVYFCGFQIWGTASKVLRGLVRMRHTGKPSLHLEHARHGERGVVLRFNRELDSKTVLQPGSWDVRRWNYKRTPKYGSGHYQLDGKPGQEYLAVRSVHLSKDGKAVFLDLPGMAKVMQMKITWTAPASPELSPLGDTVCFSMHEEPGELDLSDFAPIDFASLVALKTASAGAQNELPATVDRGAKLYTTYGCLACHSIDGTTKGKTGPSWKDLHNAERTLLDGSKVTADAAYLKEAILDPAAKIVKGFNPKDVGMPSYSGILSASDIESLVLYIQSLSQPSKPSS